MANASSLNLSELLLPSIQLFKNNQGGDSIRYENCQFNMKRKGKQAAYFKCITKDCQASLSLNVKDDVIIEPFNITNSNSVHKYETCKKDDNFFNVRIFYESAKHAVENNASLPVQQIYEAQRVKERAHSDTAFPDFNDVRSTLTRIKTKKVNLT